VIALLLALLTIPPPDAPRIAIDTVAIKQLVAHWQSGDQSKLACLHGHTETDVIVIDSAVVGDKCGAPAIGAFGFIHGDWEQDQVLGAMRRVLDARPDFLIAGEVYGLTRIPWPGGGWGTGPTVWAAYRIKGKQTS
jgi:hypothetical protein